MTKKCHCGQDLHYTDKRIKEYVEAVIQEIGEFIRVKIENKEYKVPRHYIALHGIKRWEVPKLGFEEVKNN